MANKKYNFDITVTGDSYAGILAEPYVTPAVLSPNSIENGYLSLLSGITDKAVVKRLTDDGGGVQAANCSFTDGASLTLEENVLTLTDLMVNEEICRATIYPTWVSANVNSRNADIQANFADFLMSVVAKNSSQKIEKLIYQGGVNSMAGLLSNDGAFDDPGLDSGILNNARFVRAKDSASVNATAFNKDNIDFILGQVYDDALANIPAIVTDTDTMFYVSPKTYGLYIQHLASTGSGVGYEYRATNQGFPQVSYLGIPVVACNGMFDDAMILAQKSNMFYGTNLATDLTSAQMIPAYQYDGSDNVRVTMRFGLGVQVGVVSDIVVSGCFARV